MKGRPVRTQEKDRRDKNKTTKNPTLFVGTLLLVFQPPGLWENEFLFFKLCSLCVLLWQLCKGHFPFELLWGQICVLQNLQCSWDYTGLGHTLYSPLVTPGPQGGRKASEPKYVLSCPWFHACFLPVEPALAWALSSVADNMHLCSWCELRARTTYSTYWQELYSTFAAAGEDMNARER